MYSRNSRRKLRFTKKLRFIFRPGNHGTVEEEVFSVSFLMESKLKICTNKESAQEIILRASISAA